MFNMLSDATRAARTELRSAYRTLDNLEDTGFETEEFLDANQRVNEAIDALPWWKRIDVDFVRYYWSGWR